MIGFLTKTFLKGTGLGLTIKELNDYKKKMRSEGKDPLSPTNFINEYGKPLYNKLKNAVDKTVEGKAMGGMMEARKKGMGLKMNQGGMALKPIPADNKGLPNLPKPVRNKMGYMKDGGMAKKKTVKRSPKSRGTGVAVKGTKFKGVF
tara:strand:- start:929 stop:1369 length:441 start_codon:yes stop_codon:yes gene_type:complete